MAWLAVDKIIFDIKDEERIHSVKPVRNHTEEGDYWGNDGSYEMCCVYESVSLPKGSIKKLIGRDLTWEDEPIEIKDE